MSIFRGLVHSGVWVVLLRSFEREFAESDRIVMRFTKFPSDR